MERREFLKSLGLSIGATWLPGGVVHAGHTSAPPSQTIWGTIPPDPRPAPPGPVAIWNTSPNAKILEIHNYGGLSPWETFYLRPPGANDQYRGFAAEFANNPTTGLDWGPCDDAYSTDQELLFGQDARGHDVYLGPMTRPLWTPSILDRMRIVVLKHPLQPHEAAIPYAVTGFELGRPNLASLGAVIQHHAVHSDIVNNTPAAVPYAYMCWPSTFQFPTDNLQASAAVGQHPGYSKPVVLKIRDDMTPFLTSLLRNDISSDQDRLLAIYRRHYRDALRAGPAAATTRSKGFDAYDSSAAALVNATQLNAVLDTSQSPITDVMPPDLSCPQGIFAGTNANMPGQAIELASYLLSQPGPRYVGLVDKGLAEHRMGGGYDTHSFDHNFTALNLWNVLRYLRQQIDAGVLDLNETMIVLTTEFGRDPTRVGDGRDHWPQGYVNVLIGGPVRKGVAGAILDSNNAGVAAADDGYADPANHYNPADLRAAILLAAGIYPFEPEGFGVRDISFAQASSSHWDLMLRLKTDVLGADINA